MSSVETSLKLPFASYYFNSLPYGGWYDSVIYFIYDHFSMHLTLLGRAIDRGFCLSLCPFFRHIPVFSP